MTLGGGTHTQSESVMLAYNKRKAQLERWRESDTERESIEIRNRPKRVKFADKCIFQAACAANDKNQVAKMIQDGYDINAVDEDGITALHQACIEDNLDMVEFLLTHGADVNISDNEGWTPLHAVATCCYVSIAKLLLEHGANVVALNNDCSIPLDICKSDEIREIFIQDINGKGIDLKEARKGEELKMLDDACRWLKNGYSEDPHPTTGATALHVAACKGYIKVLDLLIKASANINVKDFDGWTPLHAAAHWGQKEACEILLENNCDATLKNNCDQTAFEIADDSVYPVFENFKRKRDVNKNLEKVVNSVPNVQSLPVTHKIQQPVREEDMKIIPDHPTPKEATESHQASTQDSRRLPRVSSVEEKSRPDIGVVPPSISSEFPTSIDSYTPASSSGNPVNASDLNTSADENSALWRRSSSLRTRNIASSTEDPTKSQEKVPVRRTKGDVIADSSLRRAYSFEPDSKFYTRLRDARNRIRAIDPSSTLANSNLAIHEHTPLPPSTSAAFNSSDGVAPSTITTDLDSTKNSANRSSNNNPSSLTTLNRQLSSEEADPTRFIHWRNKDIDPTHVNAAGSPSLPSRPVGSQDVKVRRSFVPPTRDEESETQRKAHAKRVRETRRSTQGVTLEELKSAEQYVKVANSLLANNATPNDQINSSVTSSVPVSTSVSRKEEESSVERRPSWRLRVDEQDPSKFSLEDTRSLLPSPSRPYNIGDSSTITVQRSPSLKTRIGSNKNDTNVQGKPPKPPEESDKTSKISQEDEKDKDMKNSGAQGAILRKKKTKRRSTGIVQYSHDGTELGPGITSSDADVGSGSGPSSDIDQHPDSSKSENGVSSTSINYRKLYEEVLKENQLLKARLSKSEEDIADLRLKVERVSLTPRISSDDLERREKRALERKLSEMEEELKETRHLRTENQKLRDENGALIRVISKLSK